MYQKENKMVSIDSTGSDEGSCGVKDDTKHYDSMRDRVDPEFFHANAVRGDV